MALIAQFAAIQADIQSRRLEMASDNTTYFEYVPGKEALVGNKIVTGPMPAPLQPEPQVQPEDKILGCYNCRALRPGPVSFRYGRPSGNVMKTSWGGAYPLPPNEHGCCHTCAMPLQIVTCACGEPLHQAERRCRFCGADMKNTHMDWGTWWEPPTEEELAQRGNLEDEGSVFRGVRES